MRFFRYRPTEEFVIEFLYLEFFYRGVGKRGEGLEELGGLYVTGTWFQYYVKIPMSSYNDLQYLK